jgi:hypothetical protein
MKKLLVLFFVATMCVPTYGDILVYTTSVTATHFDLAGGTRTVETQKGYLVIDLNLNTGVVTSAQHVTYGAGEQQTADVDVALHADVPGYIVAEYEDDYEAELYGTAKQTDVGFGAGNKKLVAASLSGHLFADLGSGTTTATLDTVRTNAANAAVTPIDDVVANIVAYLAGKSYFYAGYIQAQIDAAAAGVPGTPTIITIPPGTYTGDLVINKAYITLKSNSPRSKTTTIIQLVDGVGIDIQGGADNFTLDGFTIKPTDGAGGTTFPIQLTNGPTDVTISNNIINISAAGIPSIAINIGAAGADSLTITGNNITFASGEGGIWGPDVVDVSVLNNTISGPTAHITTGYGIQFSGITGTSLINGNTITNCGARGIFIFGAAAGCGTTIAEDATISNNTVTQCEKGIVLGLVSQTTNMSDIDVTGNTVQSNVVGLYVANHATGLIDADTFAVASNKFVSNTTFGVQNAHTTVELNADHNWWGDASGPFNATSNPTGLGNPVSDNVDYTPYWKRPRMTYLSE